MLIEGQSIQVPTAAEAGVDTASASDSAAAAPPTATSGSHSVVAGESLSSVAAANGITVSALAAANGLAEDAMLIEGQSISVPAATPETAATSSAAPAPGLGAIESPYGTMYLESGAASSWNAMRDESLRDYGQDLYPAGPLSAYRTPDQQAGLYQQYLDGTGAPANPPGYSSHQQGLSVDVASPEMRSVIDQIGGGFGWGKLEAPDEWWHVSYGGG
jgi:LysM repeat protein